MLRLCLAMLLIPACLLAQATVKKSPVAAQLTSTLATQSDNVRQLAFDGSADTAYISTKAPTKADAVTLTFGAPVLVKSIGVLT